MAVCAGRFAPLCLAFKLEGRCVTRQVECGVHARGRVPAPVNSLNTTLNKMRAGMIEVPQGAMRHFVQLYIGVD
jgi:hypothetical protein